MTENKTTEIDKVPLKVILKIIVSICLGVPFLLILILQILMLSGQFDNTKAIIDQKTADRWTATQHREYQDKQEVRWQIFKKLNPNLIYPEDDKP